MGHTKNLSPISATQFICLAPASSPSEHLCKKKSDYTLTAAGCDVSLVTPAAGEAVSVSGPDRISAQIPPARGAPDRGRRGARISGSQVSPA